MKRFLPVCILVLILTVPAGAVDLGVGANYWFPSVTGDVRVDGSLQGTEIDLEDDLNVEDENYPAIEGFIELGKHRLMLSYYTAEYESTSTLNRNVTFKDDTYSINTKVDSRLDYDVYDFMYAYELIDMENVLAGFSIGLVGKAKSIDGTAELNSTPYSNKEDFSGIIPMAGARAHIGLLAGLLEARAIATGMDYGNGRIIDAQADISYTPFPFLDIHAGYRMFSADWEGDNTFLDYETSGPYAGLTVSF